MNKYIVTVGLFFNVQTLVLGQEVASYSGNGIEFKIDEYSSFSNDSLYLTKIVGHLIKDLEVPKIGNDGQLIKHEGYCLLYDERHEQAKWVSYQLTKAETVKHYKRTDKFKPDPKVATGSAAGDDYLGSGYDRGHLAPAADMGWSAMAASESFYYSNMSPQVPRFNRGIWKKLEEIVRDWAIESGAVYVVTGPVLTTGLQTIGSNQVSIPKYFYKVILEYGETGVKGIGFVLPNSGSRECLRNYAVSIDVVEEITGIDFFCSLENDQETVIERIVCLNCWNLL